MGTILNVLVMIFLGIVGGIPALYMFFSIPAVIGYKIYRKVRYNISIMD